VTTMLGRCRNAPRAVLMIMLTPFVNAPERTNTMSVARHALETCPGAVVIARTGAGCTAIYSAASVPSHLDRSTVMKSAMNGKPLALSRAIDSIDARFPNKLIIVVGYGCLARAACLPHCRRVAAACRRVAAACLLASVLRFPHTNSVRRCLQPLVRAPLTPSAPARPPPRAGALRERARLAPRDHSHDRGHRPRPHVRGRRADADARRRLHQGAARAERLRPHRGARAEGGPGAGAAALQLHAGGAAGGGHRRAAGWRRSSGPSSRRF